MAYPGIPSIGSGLLTQAGSSNGRSLNPVFEKTKSVTYHETLSDQIYAISAAPLGNATESIPRSIEVQNNGPVPIFIMIGYSSYSTDTAIVETDYLHILLPPEVSFTRKHLIDHMALACIETRLLFGGNLTKHPSYVNNSKYWESYGTHINSDNIMNNFIMFGVSQVNKPHHIEKIKEEMSKFLNTNFVHAYS